MPMRSRTSVRRRAALSQKANANMPFIRATARSTPHASHASKTASVSDAPRKRRPDASSSRRISAKL